MGSDVRISKQRFNKKAIFMAATTVLIVTFVATRMYYFMERAMELEPVHVYVFWAGLLLVISLIFLKEGRRLERAVIIVSDHMIEYWRSGKKKDVLVMGPDMRIKAEMHNVSKKPVVRRLTAIEMYRKGTVSILVRRDDGWTEEDLKKLWWGLYSRDKQHRFKYDTPVELIKAAAAGRPPGQA